MRISQLFRRSQLIRADKCAIFDWRLRVVSGPSILRFFSYLNVRFRGKLPVELDLIRQYLVLSLLALSGLWISESQPTMQVGGLG